MHFDIAIRKRTLSIHVQTSIEDPSRTRSLLTDCRNGTHTRKALSFLDWPSIRLERRVAAAAQRGGHPTRQPTHRPLTRALSPSSRALRHARDMSET